MDMKEMVYQPTGKQEVLYSGEYKGYKFAIMNLGTHPTAYVENKNGFPYYEEANEETDYLPHGGFTYYGEAYWDKSDKAIYIGWDYGHCGDYMGYYLNADKAIWNGDRKWATAEIYEDVKKVIDFLSEYIDIQSGKQETREKIITTVKEAIGNNASFEGEMLVLESNDVDHIAEQSADELIKAGYINGSDFVEWLKKDPYFGMLCPNPEYEEALQEYLGG